MKRLLFAAIALAASCVIAFLYLRPPQDWNEIDFENAVLDELKLAVPGYAGDRAFKGGYGWIKRRLFLEHRMFVMEGMLRNEKGRFTGPAKVSHASVETWVILPDGEKNLIRLKDVYSRPGYTLIGGP